MKPWKLWKLNLKIDPADKKVFMKTYQILLLFVLLPFGKNSAQIEIKGYTRLCEKLLFTGDFQYQKKYEFPIYTGDIDADVELIEITLMGVEGIMETTEKRLPVENCRAQDARMCWTWCRVEIPVEPETIYMVKNISETRKYKMKKIRYSDIYKIEGLFERKDVFCGKIPVKVVRGVCRFLNEEGYISDENCNMRNFSDELLEAVTDFQMDNSLFIGGVSLETLDAMGVEY